ncbi:MAG: flagellin [Pseudomonas sp.]|uniref:flagellin N-terminal helical domain-containing protein n=1 Tax=Pseudomonas sp. TaxID=306 RepID=UPI003D6DC0E8
MALTVNTNVASLSIQRNLNNAADAQGTSMKRISSGLRINSAKDDASGLQISSRLSSQINGLKAARQNAMDAISIAQTAEGALQQSTILLQRMRDLTVIAMKDSLSDVDLKALNDDFQQMSAELTRISKSTKFGTKLNLLDGSAGNMSFQVGASTGDSERITMSLGKGFGTSALFAAKADQAAVAADATTSGSRAVVNGEEIKYAIDGSGVRNLITVNTVTVTQAQIDAAKIANDNIAAAELALANAADVDKATKQADLDAAKNAGKPALDDLAAAQRVDAEVAAKNKELNQQAKLENFEAVLIALDGALEYINSSRAELGAKQNRLENTINNIDNIVVNASDSRKRIMDVDYAAETAELTKHQVLQQASTAILAQANQLPSSVLKLLQ